MRSPSDLVDFKLGVLLWLMLLKNYEKTDKVCDLFQVKR